MDRPAFDWLLRTDITFLNHGSFGALTGRVLAAQDHWRRRIDAEPVQMLGRRSEELINQAKFPVARRFGMRTDNFGFVTNATEAINAALRSLPIPAGSTLLTTDHVYNAVRQAMRWTAAQRSANYREVPVPLPVRNAQQIIDAIVSALDPSVKLLVLDHVTSPTALVFPAQPIAAECRRRGITIIIDGAHAPGMIDLDVESIGADIYTGNLHKWVCAPRGSGFLWVSDALRDTIHANVISHNFGQGLASELSWQGTRDLSAWLAIPEALAAIDNFGWDNFRQHNHDLATWAHQMLCDRWRMQPLSPLDGSLLGSMATVRLPAPFAARLAADPEAVRAVLYDHHRVEAP